MLDQQRDYVLRTVEERGVRLDPAVVHRRARQPEELRDQPGRARERARGRHDLRRLVDRRLQPHPGERRAGDARPEHVRGAAVGRPEGAPRPACSATSTTSTARRSRATRARCCAATCRPRTTLGLHVLRRPRHRVLLLRAARDGPAAGAARRGRLLRPHHHRRRRHAAQADHPHARDDEHPGRVQLPRGRPEPARDRPAPHRRAHDGRQHDDVPARGEGGRRQPGRARHVHAQAARGRAGHRACTSTCRCSTATTTRSTTPTTRTTCRRSPSSSWPACCATPPRSPRSPTRRSTATSDWCPASRRRCTSAGPATTAAA